MMKNILFVLCTAFLISCANNDNSNDKNAPSTASEANVHTPVQLNERIMALENSLEEPMLKAEAEIKVRGNNGNSDGIIQSATAMEDTIQKKVDEIKSLSPVGVGGEDYKLVAVRYFEFLKSIYTTYKELALAKDDKERAEKASQMQSILGSQQAVMANLQQAQQKYAADNGFVY